MKGKYDDLQLDIKLKVEHLSQKEMEVKTLTCQVDSLKVQDVENSSIQAEMVAVEEKLVKVQNELTLKEQEIRKLLEV